MWRISTRAPLSTRSPASWSPSDGTARRTRYYQKRVPAEIEYVRVLRRKGKLLSLQVSDGQADADDWRCFLLFRERSADLVRALCEALPLASYLSFEITRIDATHAIG